jgi:hypothetical protein
MSRNEAALFDLASICFVLELRCNLLFVSASKCVSWYHENKTILTSPRWFVAQIELFFDTILNHKPNESDFLFLSLSMSTTQCLNLVCTRFFHGAVHRIEQNNVIRFDQIHSWRWSLETEQHHFDVFFTELFQCFGFVDNGATLVVRYRSAITEDVPFDHYTRNFRTLKHFFDGIQIIIILQLRPLMTL